MEELIVHLYVLSRGVLDDLSVSDLKKFKKEFFDMFKGSYPQIIDKMRSSAEMTQDIKEAINTSLKKYFEVE